jgi:hypothetical protein
MEVLMRSKDINSLSTALLLTAFLLMIGATAAAAATAAPNGGVISGYVTSPLGYPLETGTVVKLFDADVETVRGIATPDPGTGEFEFSPVRNGLYVIKAVPPAESDFTQSFPRTISIINSPVNTGAIALTESQVTGTVFAPDGTTQVEADLIVYLGDGQVLQHVLAAAGGFKIGGLPVGSYGLVAIPRGDFPYWKTELMPLNITSPDSEQVLDLFLEEADIWGTIRDEQGFPIHEAHILASANGRIIESDLSNFTGFWAIGDLDPGVHKITALPPWPKSGLLPPEPLEVNIPDQSSPHALVFGSPLKIVSGIVTSNTGSIVSQAQVVAHRVYLPGHAETASTNDGSYELQLSPGLWALTVRPLTDTLPADWVFALPPQLVFFQHNNQPEYRTLDFNVTTADAEVIGIVKMPDGMAPPFKVTIALHNDEGVGRKTEIDPIDGGFDLSLPNGSYKVDIHADDPGYVGPLIESIVLPAEGTIDLGTITLLARDAVVSGNILVDGSPVSGIPVVGWRSGVPGSLRTTSGPDGQYALAVAEGVWHLQPAPGPEQPYIYEDSGEEVTVSPGGQITDIDFSVLAADATILGTTVDEIGDPLIDVFGWAAAFQQGSPQVHNGAPIESGSFIIHVPAGTYRVAAHLPADSPYNSSAEKQVVAVSGEQTEITLTVKTKNAQINGALWDPRNEKVVSGVDGMVGAWSGGSWEAVPIREGNGTFNLDVASGLWHLNFRIDPESGYAKLGGPWNIGVAEGRTAIVPLPIAPKDGKIQGTVLGPNGDPIPGAVVIAKGVNLVVNDLWTRTISQPDGSFSIDVPNGRYRLAAAGGEPDWIPPIEELIDVQPGNVSGGHTLQFQVAGNTISGALTISSTLEGGEALVWAWSEEGGYSHSRATLTSNGFAMSGAYTLDILSNKKWNVGAVFETNNQYWFGRSEVEVGELPAVQNISLRGPYPKPAPVVMTFDASQPQQIQLGDGTYIFIPAGALPVEGSVTLRIVPVATLPHQQHTNIYKYGYAFLASDADGEAIETHFNQEVLISFPYQEAELNALHIHEQWLKPAYFSTTMDRWIFPENFVVDLEANRVSMQIDHFTDYALTTPQSPSLLFMPVTIK